MFGLFSSPDRKMRENAKSWLDTAEQIWNFRRDVLDPRDAGDLHAAIVDLRAQLDAHAGAAALEGRIKALEPVLKRTGGTHFPKTTLTDYVEFLLLAAIVIIGVRTFFVQPFKIPTNSMWPTFNGMTARLYADKAEEPGAVATALRAVWRGAWPHRLDAPADGEIMIPIGQGGGSRQFVHARLVPGHTWLVIPTELREYTIFVGDAPVRVTLPMDFDFDWVIEDAFFPLPRPHSSSDFFAKLQAKFAAGGYERKSIDGQEVICVRTGKFVHRGDRVLSFDELTGDQLFVDRVTYNFVRPKPGQGFVFATDHIEDIHASQYYVKRLVGVPGDTIEIREPVIYRNGAPITGSIAFERNARREGEYRGYYLGPSNAQLLRNEGEQLVVPPHKYFAMGDNSGYSADSRYWGFVPDKEVMGRPLWIYFPFTSHWGPSR